MVFGFYLEHSCFAGGEFVSFVNGSVEYESLGYFGGYGGGRYFWDWENGDVKFLNESVMVFSAVFVH
jgi:hypothetical protein